jgi:hypothetical protein
MTGKSAYALFGLLLVGGPAPCALAQAAAPDACKPGFVWRDAYPGDHVCVDPVVHSRTQGQNKLAASKRSPTDRTSGPDTCLPGYVWRLTRPEDHTCVTPDQRAQAAADNAAAPGRHLAIRNMGKARLPDPKEPRLEKKTDLVVSNPNWAKTYEFTFRTVVPAFSELRIFNREPACKGDIPDCQGDPRTLVYRAANEAGVSTPSELHTWHVPYTKFKQGERYWYVIDASATGRKRLVLSDGFVAALPVSY